MPISSPILPPFRLFTVQFYPLLGCLYHIISERVFNFVLGTVPSRSGEDGFIYTKPFLIVLTTLERYPLCFPIQEAF